MQSRTYLMCPPAHFTVRYAINPWMTGDEPVEHRGYVPPNAVVVPGTRPKEFPAGTYHVNCALIVGWRSARTDLKTSLNDVLREYEIAG